MNHEHSFDREGKPHLLDNLRHDIRSFDDIFQLRLGNGYQYIITPREDIKSSLKELDEVVIYREGTSNINVPSSQAMIARCDSSMQVI